MTEPRSRRLRTAVWRMEEAGVRHWQALESGDLAKIIPNNATEGLRSKWEFQTGLMGRGYQTFAFFLVGLWAGRHRLFRAEAHRTLFKRVRRWRGGLALAISVLMTALFLIGGAMGGASQTGQAPEGGMPDLDSLGQRRTHMAGTASTRASDVP